MSNTAGAAFSVRFVRNGDQIVVTRDIIDQSGNGNSLFQVLNKETYVPTPDWENTPASRPIIRLGVRSSAGYPAEITGVTWKYDGVALTFPTLTDQFQTATNNNKFQARIATVGGKQYYDLMIVKNLITSGVIANKQIDYTVGYACNGMTDSIDGSVDVIIQAGGADSHWLQITTDHVEIDAVTTQAHLTAVAGLGTGSVTIGSGGYTIKWFKGDTEWVGQTGASVTVNRSDVDGGGIFIAKLYKDGNLVAQDSQRINDIADEYQIDATPTTGSGYSNNTGYLAPGQNAYWTLSVKKNNVLYAGEVSYSWEVFNALGVKKGEGSTQLVTLTPSMAVVGEGSGAYYSDVDVLVTATF